MRLAFALASLLLMISPLWAEEFTLSEKCSKCRTIAQQFKEGLIRTAKSNFGGGNTNWEETRLKGFAASETRLIEIMETICPSDKFCSMFLEAQEETIEKWWFDNADSLRTSTNEEGATQVAAKFAKFLCVKETFVCCPNNTYGADCTPCPTAVSEQPCSGNGNCDGDGTRSGTGKCSCNKGYVGDTCSSCDSGYFISGPAADPEQTVTCTACEMNCEKCVAGGPGQCAGCVAGYTLTVSDEQNGLGSCSDIDECAQSEESPCKTASTYCANVPGSYKCVSCDSACDSAGCSGAGPGNCLGDCAAGYRKQSEDGRCEDIDECAEAESNANKLCGEANAKETAAPICINTPGSYRCGCSEEGFEFGEGTCSPIKPPPTPPEDKKTEEGKKKYTEKKPKEKSSKKKSKRDTEKVTSAAPSSKMGGALETDFSLIHFCAMLVVSCIVVTFLASKPRPWPAVAGVLLVLTAIYVYYYVGMHEPKKGADGSKVDAQKPRSSRKS